MSGRKSSPHRLGQNHRVEENSRLGYFGFFQLFGCAVEEDVRDAEAQNLIGFFEIGFGFGVLFVQIFTHADKLCSLSGKYKCFHLFLSYCLVYDHSLPSRYSSYP